MRYRPPFPSRLLPHEIHAAENEKVHHPGGTLITIIGAISGQPTSSAATTETYQWDHWARAYVAIGAREERECT